MIANGQQVAPNRQLTGGELDVNCNNESQASSKKQQVDALHSDGDSSASSWTNVIKRGADSQQRLSVVLPIPQKSLATPTILTNEAGATPSQLFSSLMQLNGQEVGLFTGLPSCTPTSANSLAKSNLTNINPFFWGVSAFGSSNEGKEFGGQDQARATEPTNHMSNEPNQQQLSKLSLDQLQAHAILSSPLSFFLSPDSYRFSGRQHPLAGKTAPSQLPADSVAAPAQSADAERARAELVGHQQQQQQQQHAGQFVQAAQDLTNQVNGSRQTPVSIQIQSPLTGYNLSDARASIPAQPSFYQTRGTIIAQPPFSHHQLQADTQNSQSSGGKTGDCSVAPPNGTHLVSTSRAVQVAKSQAEFSTSSQTPHQIAYQPQQPQSWPQISDGRTNQTSIIVNSAGEQIVSEPLNLIEEPNGRVQNSLGPPVAHHQQNQLQQPQHQSTTMFVMGNSSQTDPRLLELQQSAARQGQTLAIHYDTGQPIGLYNPHLRQLYLAQNQQHSQAQAQHHHNQQQQHHHQQNYQDLPQQQQQQQHQPHPAPLYQNSHLYSRPHNTAYSVISPATIPTRTDPVPANNAPLPPKEATITSNLNVSPSQTIQVNGNSSSSARSSVSRDTLSVDVTAATLSKSTETLSNEVPQTKTKEPDGSSKANNNKRTKKSLLSSKEADSSNAEPIKKKSKGGRKKKIVTSEELMARKNRSKERNRVAAKRCRQKRKQFLDELCERIDKLNDLNKKLQKDNTLLKGEVDLMKVHHKNCKLKE